MKTNIIKALFGLILTFSISGLYAQSPRIKLNQIVKDTVSGSVLISNLADSNMVYSRNFYIGSDTSLVFYGTTIVAGGGGGGSFVTLPQLTDSLALYATKVQLSDSIATVLKQVATDLTLTGLGTGASPLKVDTAVIATVSALRDSLAGIISSVSTDVTLTGDGSVGNPLKVDTTTYIATKGDLNLYYLASNPNGYTSDTGTVTSVAATAGTGISISGSPITGAGTLTITNTAPDQTVSITGGGINAVSGTYPNFTITGTEVDGSVTNEIQDISTSGAAGNISISSGSTLNLNVDDADASATNEGSLTVGAGGANDAVISSNTSGSSDVTISGGTNVTVTESGQTITISSTGGGGAIPVDTFVTIAGTETITGAKTFTNTLTQSGGDVNFDSGTFFVDEGANEVGIGTTSPNAKMQVNFSSFQTGLLFNNTTNQYGLIGISALGVNKAFIGYSGGVGFYGGEAGVGAVIQADGRYVLAIDTFLNTYLGDNTLGPPTEKLDVDGNARFRSIGSGASAGALHYTSTGVLTTNTSDLRLKTNLQPLENTLQKLLNINTYSFNWINETNRVDLGMVAQQVEEIFPRLVFTNPVDGYKGIHYDKFSSILTKAIQEQQAIIESQATEIEQLKTQIQLILNEIEQIKNN